MSRQEPVHDDPPLKLVKAVQIFVEDTDQWFVTMAKDVGWTTRWAKAQLDVIVDSSVAAVQTTRNISAIVKGRVFWQPKVRSTQDAIEDLATLVERHAEKFGVGFVQYDSRFWKLIEELNTGSEEKDKEQ